MGLEVAGQGIMGRGGKAGRSRSLWGAAPSGPNLTSGVTQVAQCGAGRVLPPQASYAPTRLLLAERSPAGHWLSLCL